MRNGDKSLGKGNRYIGGKNGPSNLLTVRNTISLRLTIFRPHLQGRGNTRVVLALQSEVKI